MKTALIYCRFSPRPNAEECDSAKKQAERCEAYCNRKGYNCHYVPFTDPDTSGGVLDRPGLSAAVQAIADGSGSILVVDSVNRLARDMLVSLTIRHEVEKAGGRIEFADGTPVADTPEGRLFGNILSAFAAYERDRTRYATSRGIKRRQANGEWFGRPPVGWMRDPTNSKKLIECRNEQLAITEIARLSHRRHPSEVIAGIIQVKFGSFRGRPWSARTVRRVLQRLSENENESDREAT